MESGSNPKHVITATAVVPAQPRRVYAVIADYHHGHPHILPKQFSEMVVEKGGVGRGTQVILCSDHKSKTQTMDHLC